MNLNIKIKTSPGQAYNEIQEHYTDMSESSKYFSILTE